VKLHVLAAICIIAPSALAVPVSAEEGVRVRGGGQFNDTSGNERPSTIAFSAIGTNDGAVQGEVQYVRHGDQANAVHGEVVCVVGTSFSPERQGVGRVDFRVRGRDGVDEFFEIQAIDNGQGREEDDTIALIPISEDDVCSPFGPADPVNFVPFPVTDLGLARGNVQVDGFLFPPSPTLGAHR
jgi:hypothetical protein